MKTTCALTICKVSENFFSPPSSITSFRNIWIEICLLLTDTPSWWWRCIEAACWSRFHPSVWDAHTRHLCSWSWAGLRQKPTQTRTYIMRRKRYSEFSLDWGHRGVKLAHCVRAAHHSSPNRLGSKQAATPGRVVQASCCDTTIPHRNFLHRSHSLQSVKVNKAVNLSKYTVTCSYTLLLTVYMKRVKCVHNTWGMEPASLCGAAEPSWSSGPVRSYEARWEWCQWPVDAVEGLADRQHATRLARKLNKPRVPSCVPPPSLLPLTPPARLCVTSLLFLPSLPPSLPPSHIPSPSVSCTDLLLSFPSLCFSLLPTPFLTSVPPPISQLLTPLRNSFRLGLPLGFVYGLEGEERRALSDCEWLLDKKNNQLTQHCTEE